MSRPCTALGLNTHDDRSRSVWVTWRIGEGYRRHQRSGLLSSLLSSRAARAKELFPSGSAGSAEALEAFVFFQECFARAKGFDDAGTRADGFIISVTMNAGTALEDLRKALAPEAETSVTRARKSRRQSSEGLGS